MRPLRYRRWQTPSLSEKAESYCKPKDISVPRLIFFFFLFSLFSSSLSFKCIYWLPIGCRSILLKPINFLCLGLLFLDQKSPRLLSPRQIDSSTPGLVPRSESLFPAPPASNDSSALPGGNSSIMAGCLTGRSLMTGALYWPDCHTLKIRSQSSFWKKKKKKPVKWL